MCGSKQVELNRVVGLYGGFTDSALNLITCISCHS